MSIELPKDAEGREIPLDTMTMFWKDGGSATIARWVYCTPAGFLQDANIGWFAMYPNGKLVNPELMHLTQPDSWEKLEKDLCAAEDYANTTENDYLDSPSCIYAHSTGKSCGSCKLYGGTSCTGKMCADIASRIRRLRGEDL